jgi:hypothetical protein
MVSPVEFPLYFRSTTGIGPAAQYLWVAEGMVRSMSLQWVTCGCDLQMVDLPSLCGSTEEWISDIFWIHWIRVKSDQVIPGQKEKMHKQGERKTTWPNTKSRRPWTAKTARKAANKTHSEFIYIYKYIFAEGWYGAYNWPVNLWSPRSQVLNFDPSRSFSRFVLMMLHCPYPEKRPSVGAWSCCLERAGMMPSS